MSTLSLWLLGAIAGFTIFLGLPIGRLRNPAPRLQTFLTAVATGVLLFLFFDILKKANDTVEGALDAAKGGEGSWLRFGAYSLVLLAGLIAGLVGLVYYEQFLAGRRRAKSVSAAASTIDPAGRPHGLDGLLADPARRLAFYIAMGIGLHNFAEGLAIGQSAAKGDISLAVLLIVGFSLHNATEGFGIVAPLAGDADRPSMSLLMVLGFIGGTPTLVGTIVGHAIVNNTLFLAFLALAAGSILYVIVQLLHVASRLSYRVMLAWGLVIGLAAGLATDYILVAAGA